MNKPSINGYCDQRFRRVREAFTENFIQHEEIGASVAVCLEGQMVVDLWGGYMDADRKVPWQEDTLVNVWSLGKAMSALAILKLLEEKNIALESRVADYWPEFAAAGKGEVDFSTLLSHRTGLPAIRKKLPEDAFFNWNLMSQALAEQEPWWEPGQAHGYHTNTLGFLLGEPVRRISGQTLNDWFQDQIGQPLGVDFYMGLRKTQLPRAADLIHRERPADKPMNFSLGDESSADPMEIMRYAVYRNPMLQRQGPLGNNSSAWRMAEFPSTSPQSNARSVARIFGELARPGQKLISQELLARATRIHSDGEDRVLGRPTRFGLGFQLTQPDRPLGPNAGTFGHYGNGGHLGFADPLSAMGFAYHMNHHGYAWRDPRNIKLTDAVYECLGAGPSA